MELEQIQSRVQTLSKRLQERRPEIDRLMSLHDGKTGKLKFASERFGEYVSKQFEGFSDNWCAPVAQAAPERMNFLGIRPAGAIKGVSEPLQRVLEDNDADGGFSTAFLVTGVTGRAFTLVHPGEEKGKPRITFEHPASAIVDTNPVTGVDREGLVTWVDDKKDYAAFYTADGWAQFSRNTEEAREVAGKARSQAELASTWDLDEQGWRAHKFGMVPLTELRNQDLLDDNPRSDIAGVGAMQEAINLVWAYLLNHLDQASLPARIITGADVPKIPILDKDGQVVGHREVELDELMKERILWIPGKDVGIHEWTAAALDVFGKVISQMVEHVAAQTRTPPHYLVAKMVNTSGDALTVAETGLVAKTEERIRYVKRGVRKTCKLLAVGADIPGPDVEAIGSGKLIWKSVAFRSEAQLADALVKYKDLGFPFEWLAERLGLDPSEVDRVVELRKGELSQNPALAMQQFMGG
ncbi:phage portal protein [Arthrobacter woluwensis]|uniref:phage portal protein n=1 Tax=Arthrobacter woluwensis TaxID=156980 RepID=UPI001AAEA972|nr:phage portal protein [Arthrobacter woluwensis]QTF70604.1 phage portal protein [Arthrobacter woluwensis]